MKLDKLGQKKVRKRLFWVCFLLVIAYLFYDVLTKQNELEDYGVSTKATITYIHSGNKGIRNIEYEFAVNNKTYIGHGEIPWLTCLPCEVADDGCIGSEIDIIYSKRDPEIVETNFSDKLIKIEDQDPSKMLDYLKDKVTGE